MDINTRDPHILRFNCYWTDYRKAEMKLPLLLTTLLLISTPALADDFVYLK